MDIQLYYTEYGEGEPLILLHGNGENQEYFIHQIEYFKKYYRVIAIDTRGHGKSPRGKATFSIAQFSEDLHDFIKEHEIKKAHVLGFSDGGNIALTFALKYPEQVDKLILNGANLNTKGIKFWVQCPVVIGYYIASFFGKMSKEAKKNAEMLGLMVKEPNFLPEDLHRLNKETLVIAGTKDMIKTSHTKEIYGSLPNGKLVLLEGDHFIANKKPEEFNQAVREFLRSDIIKEAAL